MPEYILSPNLITEPVINHTCVQFSILIAVYSLNKATEPDFAAVIFILINSIAVDLRFDDFFPKPDLNIFRINVIGRSTEILTGLTE